MAKTTPKLSQLDELFLSARISMRKKRQPLPSLADFAKKAGISSTYLYLVTTGQRTPSDAVLAKIASLLGITKKRLTTLLP